MSERENLGASVAMGGVPGIVSGMGSSVLRRNTLRRSWKNRQPM